MKSIKIFLLVILFGQFTAAQVEIRTPARAGQFYPASAEQLRQSIKNYLINAEKILLKGEIKGLWVPHAGYQFSAQIAANAYNCIKDTRFDLIILLGPSHYSPISGASIGNYKAYATPLGNAWIDTLIAEKIRSESSLIQGVDYAHRNEHSLEVQIPFLQVVQPEVPIIPILIGYNTSYSDCKKIASVISAVCKQKKALIIASSDMSHFPDYSHACEVDNEMLKVIQTFNPKRIVETDKAILAKKIPSLDCTLCGMNALITMMFTVKELGGNKVRLLSYANSGDVLNSRERVVGYGAGVFLERTNNPLKKKENMMDEINFSQDEKKKLFNIARKSIRCALKGETLPSFSVTSDNLKEKRGVFVTLMNREQLRGCIGYFEAVKPLYLMVSQMAAAAATQDYRFAYNPVTEKEMDEINIKISILSKLKKVNSIDDIEVGKHGIWIKQGMKSGTYLPEVATEMGWNKIEFLEHCCAEKAGLPRDAWKKNADIYIYSSQILDEKDI